MEVGAKTSTGPTLQRRLRPPKRPLQELRSRVTRGVSCSLPRLRSTFLGFFPVVSWLPRYRLREYVWGDVMSGLIVGIILVPQAIAYCLLAGVQPVYGLYTSFFANIIYFFMGTSRHVSVGIFSLMSLMVGQVVDREVFLAGFELGEGGAAAAGNGSLGGGANGTTTELACGKECYAIGIAAALTFLAGIYQVLMAVFRLGFVSVYLSAPMLDGFATGASFTILTVQAKYLLGLKIPRYQGYGTVVVTWFRIFSNIQHTNMCDLVTSAICISVLVAGKELQERFKSRLKIPLPTELLVVTAATLASHFADLGGRYASSVSGHIPTGFVAPEVPRLDLMPRVALDAVPLAVISFAFTVSLSEMFAKKNGYSVRPNQEMLAIGCCNIVPSFFHCFTTSAALAKTMVKDSTGCQTQVSSLVSALVVLLVLLFFAPYFYALQKCVLACIIIVSLRGALRKFLDVPDKWRASKADAVVWLVTTASSALISVELGLLVGVAFSMGVVVYRTQNAAASLLGRADGSELYEDMEEYRGLSATPGVRVFRFRAPLYYANKDAFAKSLYKAVGLEPFAELARRRKAQKKKKARELETAKRAAVGDVGGPSSSSDKTNGEASVRLTSGGGGGGEPAPDFHAIVLDCSSVPFVDSAGAAAFGSLRKEYGEVGVSVLLAACNTDVVDALSRASYFGKGGGDAETDALMFHTVHAAVLRAAAAGATSAANAATATAASVV